MSSYLPKAGMDINPFYLDRLSLGHVFFVAHLVGSWGERKIVRYIYEHNLNLAHSNWTSIRTIYRTYNYLFPVNTRRRHFMNNYAPKTLTTTLHVMTSLYIINSPFAGGKNKAIQGTLLALFTLCITYLIDTFQYGGSLILPPPFDLVVAPILLATWIDGTTPLRYVSP